MGITRTFKGFDEEAFALGMMESSGWKEYSDDVSTGDLTEVTCIEVPKYTDESKQIEIKKIGTVKRSPVKFIGAGQGKLVFKQLMTNDYMNVLKGLIESTIGKLILTFDVTGVSEVQTVTFNSKYQMQATTGSWDNIWNKEKQVQLVGIYDIVTDKILDMDIIVNALSGGNIADVALGAKDTIDITGATEYNVKALGWIDMDVVPDQLIDFVVQRASNFDFANDPEFEGGYDGAEVVRLRNALGTVKLDLPLEEQSSLEYEFMSDDHELVDPTPDSLPVIITVSGTGGSGTGAINIKSKGSYEVNLSIVTGDAATTATNIQTAINGHTDFTATVSGNVVTITDSVRDFLEINITADVDLAFDIVYNEPDMWQKYNEPNNIKIARVAWDSALSGTNYEVVNVSFSNTVANAGSIARLFVNGIAFDYHINDGDGASAIAAGLDTAINNKEFTLDGVTYRDIRFNSAAAGSGDINITALTYDETLDVSFELIDSLGTGDTAAVISTTTASLADEATDDAPFFKLSKIKWGEASIDMKDFCEVASLSINFQRDLSEIKSICSATGRKGWNNTSFTIGVEVATTDIDAERIYRLFKAYKTNKTFALGGVDADSGFGFYFPACRIEKMEKTPMDNLQGHKITINVNFDPNKKPLLALNQLTTY